MYTCHFCKRLHATPSLLVDHIRMFCKYTIANSPFCCGENNCKRHYYSASSFKNHLIREHSSNIYQDNSAKEIPHRVTNLLETAFIDPENIVPLNISQHPETSTTFRTDEKLLEYHALDMISSLYANPMVPRKTVQVFLDNLLTFFVKSENYMLNRFNEMASQSGQMNTNIDIILKNILQNNSKTLQKFDTEHKRFKHFKQLGTLLESREVVIGQRLETKQTYAGISMMSVPCTEQVMPLKEILQLFFSTKGMLQDTLNYLHYLKTNSFGIENIIQGSVWTSQVRCHTEKDDEIVLPLVIYFDDFEIGNPLGSHAGIHKLGGVYVSLPCLPPYYVSMLQNIFILALFHSSDRVNFGNNIIFQKNFDALNDLKVNGIQIESEIFRGVIKFHVAAVTGDNLGLNGILGFVESFSANRPCRVCTANKEQIKSLHYENTELLRNKNNYTNDLKTNDPSTTGVKEKSAWFNLEGFDLFENVAVDMLHDYLEGCCRYIMTFVVASLVQKQRLITFENLKSRIQFFDYGPDSTSKPSNAIVQDGSSIKLKCSASEMLSLVRYFGLIVGMNVPDENDVWLLYIKLRRLLDKLISHRIHDGSIEEVKFLVAEINELYSDLSGTDLKPKFHFLTHYPNMLRKFGPLPQFWTMRFEAKHRVSKFVARASCSRKNICKTIAIKNQLLLNDFFFKNKPICKVFPGRKIIISELEAATISGFTNDTIYNWHSVTSVRVKGVRFDVSSIVVTDISEFTCFPAFAEVKSIYISNVEKVVFNCLRLETVDFDQHYYGYVVNKTTNNFLWSFDDLLSPAPCTITLLRNLKYYITVRWTLD